MYTSASLQRMLRWAPRVCRQHLGAVGSPQRNPCPPGALSVSSSARQSLQGASEGPPQDSHGDFAISTCIDPAPSRWHAGGPPPVGPAAGNPQQVRRLHLSRMFSLQQRPHQPQLFHSSAAVAAVTATVAAAATVPSAAAIAAAATAAATTAVAATSMQRVLRLHDVFRWGGLAAVSVSRSSSNNSSSRVPIRAAVPSSSSVACKPQQALGPFHGLGGPIGRAAAAAIREAVEGCALLLWKGNKWRGKRDTAAAAATAAPAAAAAAAAAAPDSPHP